MTVERSDFAQIEELLREISAKLDRLSVDSALKSWERAPGCAHEWVTDSGGTRCIKCGERSGPGYTGPVVS